MMVKVKPVGNPRQSSPDSADVEYQEGNTVRDIIDAWTERTGKEVKNPFLIYRGDKYLPNDLMPTLVKNDRIVMVSSMITPSLPTDDDLYSAVINSDREIKNGSSVIARYEPGKFANGTIKQLHYGFADVELHFPEITVTKSLRLEDVIGIPG
jgi:hypothetical protein